MSRNAPAAITRMLQMGIEPYLVSSAMRAVVAQRLVRKVCSDCRVSKSVDEVLAEKVQKLFSTNWLRIYTNADALVSALIAGEIDLTSAGKIDAVVHLAGENVAGRWTKKKRARILNSRRDGTRLLSEAIARLPEKPAVMVSASGINYYELDPLNPQDEDSPIGTSFLAEVCRTWEDHPPGLYFQVHGECR